MNLILDFFLPICNIKRQNIVPSRLLPQGPSMVDKQTSLSTHNLSHPSWRCATGSTFNLFCEFFKYSTSFVDESEVQGHMVTVKTS